MGIIGRVGSVWRYPVKSMRGEAMVEIFAGFSGVYGDRLYRFQELGGARGISLFHRAGKARDAALPPALSPPGKGGLAPQPGGSRGPLSHPQPHRCRPGRPRAGCRDAVG
jgi:hypothetical protein